MSSVIRRRDGSRPRARGCVCVWWYDNACCRLLADIYAWSKLSTRTGGQLWSTPLTARVEAFLRPSQQAPAAVRMMSASASESSKWAVVRSASGQLPVYRYANSGMHKSHPWQFHFRTFTVFRGTRNRTCQCLHVCTLARVYGTRHAQRSPRWKKFSNAPLLLPFLSVIFFPTPVTSATTIRANWLSSARCWVTCTLCVRASFATLTSARSMSLSRFLSDFLMLLMFLTWIYLLVHLGTYRRIFVRLFAYVCAYKNIPTYTYTRIRMLLSWSCLYLCHLTYMYTYIHSYMPQIFVLSLFWILRGQNWNWNTSAHSKNVQM